MLGLLGLVGKFAAGFVVTWVIGIVVPHHETSVTLSGAIADRTLRASKTVDAFRANFHDRLAVLDRAGRTASTTPTTPAASSREADYWAVRSNRGRRNKSEEQAHMTEPTNEELATCEAEALDIGAAFHAFLEAKERWIDAYQKDGSDRFAALTQLIRYLIAEREASAGGPPQSVSEFKHDPLKVATVDGVAIQEEAAAHTASSVNSTDDPDDVE